MGLDNYWVEQGNDNPVGAEGATDLNVCGGMCSGNGTDSFRGKVYARLTEAITGQDLYNDRIDAETVRQMANDLKDYNWMPRDEDNYRIDENEYSDYVKMFEAHAKANHELISWW